MNSRNHFPRILCISPLFVPIADSEAFCGAKMVMALFNSGYDITVLCDWSNTSQIEGRFDSSELWKPAIALSKGIEVVPHRERFKAIRMALRFRSRSGARWIGKAVRMSITLNQNNPFDLVYSRSLPASAHLAAYWISKSLNIPWIANINDAWDYHLSPGLATKVPYSYSIISNYWLRKTLRTADLVTYPSERLRNYLSKIAEIEEKGVIIPHIGYCLPGNLNNGGFTLIHAGVTPTSGAKRSSEGLLVGLCLFFTRHPEARMKSQMIFVGPEDPGTKSFALELGLNSIVKHTGRVNYEDSLRYIGSSSVCVLIEHKMSEGIYLPSKLADYLIARKAILALSPKIGTVADMSSQGGIERVDSEDSEAIAAKISNYYLAFKRYALAEVEPPERLVRKFQENNVCGVFRHHVQEVLLKKI